jgi:hypothetical protein
VLEKADMEEIIHSSNFGLVDGKAGPVLRMITHERKCSALAWRGFF